MTNFAPALMKPTATLLIDDDRFFINNVKSLLPTDTHPTVYNAGDLTTLGDMEVLWASGNISKSFRPDSLNSLKKLFDSDDIPVSTLVIDQSMEPRNGLDIFKDIKSCFVQKILISNFLHQDEALQALNAGVINFYLSKMQPNFIQALSETIYQAQQKFFHNLSLLTPNFFDDDNPLTEPDTIALFKRIQAEFSVKYYETNSNFRLFSFAKNDSQTSLKIRFIPEEELEMVLQSQQSETAPKEVLQSIRSGKMLPCFDDNSVPEGDQWVQYLRPAETLCGKSTKYFYSVYWGA